MHPVITPIPCFVTGTLITTPLGERPVEALRAGDSVLTADGSAQRLRWAGRRVVETLNADPVHTLPVRIRAGALAECVPARDLLVSPGHAMFIEDVLIAAGALVNGTSILREQHMPPRFTYHHLELPNHTVILAESAPTESFLDGLEPAGFDNWFERADGEAPALALPYPRATAARQVPLAVRQHLAARAALLAPALAAVA